MTVHIVDAINSVLLYKIFSVPLLIWCFIGTSVLIMIKIRFANITYFPAAIKYAFGKKDKSDSGKEGIGAITALMSQLACNLGIGNFAGSVFALYYGGPGVIFWFFVLSVFSSSIKFGEVVLAHKYRTISKGEIKGGTFYFIEQGLGKKYSKSFVKILAIASALSIVFIGTTTSSMQFNQINALIFSKYNVSPENIQLCGYLSAIIIGLFAGILLFGGLKKVGTASDIMVPFMGVMYIGICLMAISLNHHNIKPALNAVWEGVFNCKAGFSAAVATFLFALQKIINATDTAAGFSAISQSNSNLKIAGQQGLVSFFDPLIVATIMAMGAFSVLVVGVPYHEIDFLGLLAIKQVFVSINHNFDIALILIAFLFGFSTIMAVGFYVQQACIYLFGSNLKSWYIILYIVVYSMIGISDVKGIFLLLDVVYSAGVVINLIAISLLSQDIKLLWQEYLDKKDK